jgi:hypothetical protein
VKYALLRAERSAVEEDVLNATGGELRQVAGAFNPVGTSWTLSDQPGGSNMECRAADRRLCVTGPHPGTRAITGDLLHSLFFPPPLAVLAATYGVTKQAANRTRRVTVNPTVRLGRGQRA